MILFFIRAVRSCRLFLFTSVLLLAGILSPLNAQQQSNTLSLSDATKRVLAKNPNLQGYQWQFKQIEGKRQTAALKPGYQIDVEAENLLGSGEASGIGATELTVSLSSILELGGKRNARLEVSDARYAMTQAQQQADSLDLLGQMTQQFIHTLTLQAELKLSHEATNLAEKALTMVTQRVSSGAVPEAEQLRAKAALRQAQLTEAKIMSDLHASKVSLASFWGQKQPKFDQVGGKLLHFESSPDFEQLYQRILATPAIEVFARRERLRDAQIRLAQAQSSSNLSWRAGVKRSQSQQDTSLVAGISVPLFAEQRNQGDISAAIAAKEAVRYERQANFLALRAQLYQAWRSHQFSVKAARHIQAEILPPLQQAFKQTDNAYQRGRYGYTEWVSSRQALLDAKHELLKTAQNALMNQALIEQLSGTSLSEQKGFNHE